MEEGPGYTDEDRKWDAIKKDKKKNKFCPGQRAVSNKYRENYDRIKWNTDEPS